MNREKLLEIIKKYDLDNDEGADMLADEIIAAGPVLSDEVLEKLRLSRLDAQQPIDAKWLRGFDRALEIMGILDAVTAPKSVVDSSD